MKEAKVTKDNQSMTHLVIDWIWGHEDEGNQEWYPVFCLGD